MKRPGKQIVCRVRVDELAKAIEFTWSEGSASFRPYALVNEQATIFRQNVEDTRKQIFRLVQYHACPIDKRDAERYRQDAFKLAQLGLKLYKNIFDRAARDGGQTDKIAEWLRSLTASGEVESLEIVCDGQPWFAPWNLVYDELPKDVAFVPGEGDGLPPGFDPFWGMRYNLCGGQTVDPLRRVPLPTHPKLLVVVDPKVFDDLRDYTQADGTTQRDRLERFLDGHGLVPVTSLDGLTEALVAQRPHIIYWLGHAKPEALYLGRDPVDQSTLRYLLNEMKREPDQSGGLVFLNCCRTAEPSDLGSFLKTFHDFDFSGLIATEEQTIDSFANPFGLEVLEQFLVPGTAIGGTLHTLRQSHGPLGLLYGAYCPPDLHVRPEDGVLPRAARPRVIDLTAAGGRSLGVATAAEPDYQIEAWQEAVAAPLPDAPYLPLELYGPEHRALFAGRDGDIARFAMLLGRPETRMMVLHGESGVGKSSFLRAGLIPFLEEDCIGYRFLRDRRPGAQTSILFVRSTGDPAAQLAQALAQFCGKPYVFESPAGESISVDLKAILAETVGVEALDDVAALQVALRDKPSLFAQLLAALGASLPETLVLVLDQAEEVFTLADAMRGPDPRALAMIASVAGGSGDYKLVVSLRTEYYGRMVVLCGSTRPIRAGFRDYLLSDLDESQILEAILRPALDTAIPHATEVPYQRYRFRYEAGVAEEIARGVLEAGRRDGVLPLVQVICAQLYDRLPKPVGGTITRQDLIEVGGLDGGMVRNAEALVARVTDASPLDRAPLKRLLTRLYLQQPDGTLTTALWPAEDLAHGWTGRQAFQQVLARAAEARLLRVDSFQIGGREGRPYVSLGHDALARVAAKWDAERIRNAQARKFVSIAAVVVALAAGLVGWQRYMSTRIERSAEEAVRSRNVARDSERVANASREMEEEQRKLAEAAKEAANVSRENEAEQRKLADAAKEEAHSQLAAVYLERGLSLARSKGQTGRGLLWLAKGLEYTPEGDRDLQFLVRNELAATAPEAHSLAAVYPSAQILDTAFSSENRPIIAYRDGPQRDTVVRLRDAATGEELGAPLVHNRPVASARFDPTAAKVLTNCPDGVAASLQLWDVATGRRVGKPLTGQTLLFSTDGRLLVTVDPLSTSHLIDAATGAPIGPPIHVPLGVRLSEFRPDSKVLAVVGGDNIVRSYDATTGAPAGNPFPGGGSVSSLSFSPDGGSLAVSSLNEISEQVIRLHDSATGRVDAPLLRETGTLLAASPDGVTVVTKEPRGLRFWDAASGRPRGALMDQPAGYTFEGFSADGRRILVSSPGSLRVWEVSTSLPAGEPILVSRSGLMVFALSADGERVAAAIGGRSVHLWTSSGRALGPPDEHDRTVSLVAFAGRTALVAGDAQMTTFRDADTGATVARLAAPVPGGFARVLVDRDGKLVATAEVADPAKMNGALTVRCWSPATGQRVGRDFAHFGPAPLLAFRPDGAAVLTSGDDRAPRLVDVTTGERAGPPLENAGPIAFAAFSDDGRRLAAADAAGSVRVWDLATGRLAGPPITARPEPGLMALDPDGRALVTAAGSVARLWDVGTGNPIDPPMIHKSRVDAVTFRSVGRTVVTRVPLGGSVHFWDARTAKPADPPVVREVPARSVVFGSEGQIALVVGSQTARRWDLAAGKFTGGPVVHHGGLEQVVLSPDGRTVAGIGYDKALRFWDAGTGAALGPPVPVGYVQIGPHGRTLADVSGGETRLYDTVTGRLVYQLDI